MIIYYDIIYNIINYNNIIWYNKKKYYAIISQYILYIT